MTNEWVNSLATATVLAWNAQGAHLQHAVDDEEAADVDEPPDPARNPFKRTPVPKIVDHSESLLTKALNQSSGENVKVDYHASTTRRRSLNSNISIESAADLTSDTGLTSPARTNTPSPPPPVVSLLRLNTELSGAKREIITPGNRGVQAMPTHQTSMLMPACDVKRDAGAELLQKKRRISFVCGPKAEVKKPSEQSQCSETPSAAEEKPPRKTCIKFACPAKPVIQDTPSESKRQTSDRSPSATPTKRRAASPALSRKHRSPSTTSSRLPRSLTPRPAHQGPSITQPSKYLTANDNDLSAESSQFHEFASDEPVQEDWLRQNVPSTSNRLTINDTLQKENKIRQLGEEAEEEALEEEEQEEEAELENEDDDDADLMNDFDEDDDAEDEEGFDSQSDCASDEAGSDGYNTDNEIGFAESEDEDDGDLQLWTPGNGLALRLSNDTPMCRRPSSAGGKSDSSSSEGADVSKKIRGRSRRIKFRPGTPELPDSTDFVCGTLDEDRALENAYISCMAVKRREKLHLIPQDIDPSFPTSEPEDQEIQVHRRGHDSDEPGWLHGDFEDLHHVRDQDGEHRTRKLGAISPKRYHSPPPKSRGRSPKRLFDRQSPRRLLSPPPPNRAIRSPPASLVRGGQYQNSQFRTLAFRPGLTHTKSLPRAEALFPQHIKNQRQMHKPLETGGHVRGAIDIVKGLEQKRQRRREKFKEKFLQKHNDKARKGQLPQQRPQPGKGAERMREIGLLAAGKLDPDRYVLSV